MKTYRINKKSLCDFLVERRIIQLLIVIVPGIMLLKSNLDFEITDKAFIGYLAIMLFCWSMIIGILLLLRKFNRVIKGFISWDTETVVRIDHEQIEVDKGKLTRTFKMSELTVENHGFYGWYSNPLFNLGYVVIKSPEGEAIQISSLLFDLRGGVDKVDELFRDKVRRYSKITLNWFDMIPSNKT